MGIVKELVEIWLNEVCDKFGQPEGWNYSWKRELQTDKTSELKHDRNRCESVNSVLDRILEDRGAG